MKKVIVLLIPVVMCVMYFFCMKKQSIKYNGVQSSYVTDNVFGNKVYYRQHHGDFLLGGQSYDLVLGDAKKMILK